MAALLDISWLWGDTRRSDVTLHILPAGDAPDGSWTTEEQPAPIRTLYLHAVILGSVSPSHLRGKLDRWTDARPQSTDRASTAQQAALHGADNAGREPPAKRPRTRAAARASDSSPPAEVKTEATNEVATTQAAAVPEAAPAQKQVLHLTCYPGEPDTVPEAVLRHAYTGQLPDDATQLSWMVWRADYLDMAGTVNACLTRLQQLADSKQLSVADIQLLGTLPDLQTPDAKTKQQQIITTVILTHFGNTYDILTTPATLAHFIQIPFNMLQRWGELRDKLFIDHENTLVVLLTAWHDAQRHPPPDRRKRQMSDLVQLPLLTVSFHLQTLDRLKWFRHSSRVPPSHAALHALMHLVPGEQAYVQQKLSVEKRPAQQAPPPAPPVVTREYTRVFTRQQIAQLWRDKGTTVWHADKVYFCGVDLKIGVQLQPAEPAPPEGAAPQWSLHVYIQSHWPAALAAHWRDTQWEVSYPACGLTKGYTASSGAWNSRYTAILIGGGNSSRTSGIPKLVIESEHSLITALDGGMVIKLSDPK